MKTLLLTLLLLLTITAAWAQAPQRISYQSIIRDANNVVVASSAVRVKISLLQGTSTGPAVYVETHGITTNANGLVSLNIGEGTAITGSFAGIDWSNGPYLIQTATDPTGGTDYSIIGFAPLNSVPYALNAANASVATTLAGTLPMASGGTGATTATAAIAALGLENVDNTSDANKPVSTATQSSLATKVDKVTGKELSTNDYSTAEKVRLAAITNDLAAKVDKVTGKELSTNDYSTAEKGKLAAITGNNTGDQVNIAGNAATATKLQATVTINGIAFDGSANITLPAAAAGIPYTGADRAVDLGAYDLKVNGLTIGRGGGNVDGNTANGSMSLYSNSSGNSNTAYGYASLYSNTSGSSNIANGNQSLYFNTTGSNNTAIGNASLNSNTTGSYNTAVGPSALYSNTIGSNNTATGYIALYKNTTGTDNTASGMFALYANTTGAYNTATGFGALSANTAGVYNTATGYVALASNTTGLGNQASGNYALTDNTTGNSNAASGYSALRANTTGSNNTASGYNALDANTTGSNNTAIGYYANVGSAALTNATAIGSGATVLASNTIQLGDANVQKVITSGTLTAGAVTYPNVHNTTAGQVLTTNVSGVASWTTPATGLPSSGNTAGDMLFWNGSAWIKVAAGSNGQTLTFYNGAPVWTGTISYANTVVNSTTGKIWMDRNLGATQVAMSSTDAASYGDLYQWGRAADGHQIRNSATTSSLSSTDNPSHGDFITYNSGDYDWRSPQNNSLWQGVSGTNNPCPSGYRIPTETEWEAERLSWGTNNNAAGAFASPLKLPMAGTRYYSNGSLMTVGTYGYYWSSSVIGTASSGFSFLSSNAFKTTYGRLFGFSVRCIKN